MSLLRASAAICRPCSVACKTGLPAPSSIRCTSPGWMWAGRTIWNARRQSRRPTPKPRGRRMDIVPYPAAVDPARYAKDIEHPPALYGLPEEVKFCRSCVISNQRPNSAVEYEHTKQTRKTTIHFDVHGVCDACNFAERKQRTIDWESRDKQLRELCDRHRKLDGSYDCIVPGSGGKDSFYASQVLKTKYGMHPLTVTWA